MDGRTDGRVGGQALLRSFEPELELFCVLLMKGGKERCPEIPESTLVWKRVTDPLYR